CVGEGEEGIWFGGRPELEERRLTERSDHLIELRSGALRQLAHLARLGGRAPIAQTLVAFAQPAEHDLRDAHACGPLVSRCSQAREDLFGMALENSSQAAAVAIRLQVHLLGPALDGTR